MRVRRRAAWFGAGLPVGFLFAWLLLVDSFAPSTFAALVGLLLVSPVAVREWQWVVFWCGFGLGGGLAYLTT